MQALSDSDVRDYFIQWQCRIRQDAMRRDGGRPSPAMRPRVLDRHGNEIMPHMVTLLVPQNPDNDIALFKFQVQKNNEAQKVYQSGLKFLQGDYFQQPDVFSDVMTAQLAAGSPTAARLVELGTCMLEFSQYNQTWRMICKVGQLDGDDPARELTLWHNRLFNPQIANNVTVLSFTPDWQSANADPKLPGQ